MDEWMGPAGHLFPLRAEILLAAMTGVSAEAHEAQWIALRSLRVWERERPRTALTPRYTCWFV
jgi:hypothetical protein